MHWYYMHWDSKIANYLYSVHNMPVNDKEMIKENWASS